MIVLEYTPEQARAYRLGRLMGIVNTLAVFLFIFCIYSCCNLNRGLTFTTYIDTERQDLIPEAQFDRTVVTTRPNYKGPTVSVDSIFSTTCPVGWRMAEVHIGVKKFTILYDRSEEREFGWDMGTNKKKITYVLTDESNPPGPNGRMPSTSPFVIRLIDSHSQNSFKISGVELLSEKTYSPESGLQTIILKHSEEDGREIFGDILDALEKLQPPPPLRDE